MSTVRPEAGPDMTDRERKIHDLQEKVRRSGLSPINEGAVLSLHDDLLEAKESKKGLTKNEGELLPWLKKWHGIVLSRQQKRNPAPED